MAKPIYELEAAKDIMPEFSEERNNVMIVDGLNLAFRYKHRNATTFAEEYLKTVNSFAKSYDAKKTIVLSDWGSSSYRMDKYPEYKADRKERIEQQTEEEQEAFIQFIEEFNRALELCSSYHLVLKYKNVEADDIAAYIARYYLQDFEHDIWLISSDKDWDMFLNERVHRFSYVTRKEYKLDNWSEHYDFPHDLLLDIKVIQGGKDNVKGVEGIGEKRAYQLVKKYGGAFDIYDSLPIPGVAKYIKNLNEFGDNILRNMELMDKVTYCNEAIGLDNIEEINEKLEKHLCF